MMKLKNNQTGFTLIEIMIAVGLLGGLAVAGMTLFKNQNTAQKTVESNYEVTTTLNQIRAILSDVPNCTATFGGQPINGGVSNIVPSAGVFAISKKISGVNTPVYPTGAILPGGIKINSYDLTTAYPGLQAGETILKISFGRGKGAIKDEITKFVKMVYTTPPATNITSCYAFTAQSDGLWQINAADTSEIYYDGNVGIGTGDPATKLDVVQIGATPGIRVQGGTNPSIRIDGAGGVLTKLQSVDNAEGIVGTESGHPLSIRTGNTQRIYVTAAGNVGVGTTSPLSKLQVLGTTEQLRLAYDSTNYTSFTVDTAGGISMTPGNQQGLTTLNYIQLNNDGTTNHTHINLRNTSPTGVTSIDLNNGLGLKNDLGTNKSTIYDHSNLGLEIATSNAVPISFTTANTEKMRIDYLGRVGIGTTTPSTKLDVNGGIKSINGLIESNNLLLQGDGTNGYVRTTNTSSSLYLGSSNANYVMIDPVGNVGIGVMAPVNALEVLGNISAVQTVGLSGFTQLWNDNSIMWKLGNVNGGLRFGSATGLNAEGYVQRMILLDNGNLSVSGSVSALGFVYSSDRRLKKDISTIENPLDKISYLRGVNFTWLKDNKKDVGFIAQEVEKVVPELVDTDAKGMKSVKYGNIVAIIVEALKELRQMVMNLISDQDDIKVEQQKMWDEIKSLREENKQLKMAIDRKKQIESSESRQ